jgi:hypothetical protein
MVVPGTVIAFADSYLGGRQKWQVCVCPQRRLFLRINHRPIWRPHFLLTRAEHPWLRRDSYVELRVLFRFDGRAVERACASPAAIRGDLTEQARFRLVTAACAARTLPQEDKDIITEMMGVRDDAP